MVVAFHSMYLNITFTSARCCNFTTPSSIGMYRIITLFTILIDDYFPLGGSPRPVKMISPWEVPETSRNQFLPGKSLENDFSFGKFPRPLRIKEVMPLSTTTPPPHPPTFMSTFPSYVFLPTWRVSPSSSNFLETSAGTRDSPRLLQMWPLATFMVK